MAKPLKLFLALLGGLVALLLAAVLALPFFFDPNDFRQQISEAVKRETGRDFAAGNIRLTVFPWLKVELADVTLGNAAGFGAEPMLTAQRAEVGVRLLPLLRERRVEASALTLEGATLRLAVDAEGRSNWQDLMKPDAAATAPPPPVTERLRALDFGGLALRNLDLRFDDAQQPRTARLQVLKLDTGALRHGAPFTVEAQLTGEASAAGQPLGKADAGLAAKVTLAENGDVGLSGLTLRFSAAREGAAPASAEATLAADALDYTAATQVISTGPATIQLARFSLAQAGGATLSGQGDLAATLRYTIPAKTLALDDLRLGADLSRSGAAPLATAFKLTTAKLTHQAASQQLDIAPMTVQLDRLVTGAADKPTLTAQGRVTLPLVSALGAKRHRIAALSGELLVGGSSVPGGKAQAVKFSAAMEADLAAGLVALAAPRVQGYGLTLEGQRWRLSEVLGERPRFNGDVAVAPFEPRALLTALGIAAPNTADATTFKSASLAADVEASASGAALSALTAKLDDTTLRGSLAVRDFTRQALRFALTADRLDADRYLPPAAKPAVGATATPAAKTDFNATPLPFESLEKLDIDGTLEVASFKLKNLKLADARVTLKGTPGGVQRQTISTRLYGGRMDYASSLAPGAVLDLKLKLASISAAPLLKDFLDSDKLSGTADLALDLAGAGRTIGAVRQSMDGTLAFTVRDGAVKGFNLGKVLRDGQALLARQAPAASSGSSTDFAELTGSGVIRDGVLTSDDLSAKSPLLRLEGEGQLDLARETISYLARPALVNTAAGQGGKTKAELESLIVPIRLSGNLYAPKVAIDWQAALKQQAVTELREKLGVSEETVREKREELREKAKEELSKGLLKLFGNKPAPTPAPQPEAAPEATPAPAPEAAPPPAAPGT